MSADPKLANQRALRSDAEVFLFISSSDLGCRSSQSKARHPESKKPGEPGLKKELWFILQQTLRAQVWGYQTRQLPAWVWAPAWRAQPVWSPDRLAHS